MNTSITRRYIGEALALATVLTALMTWATQRYTDASFNGFETASVFFSFGSTWLCTRQVRFNYILAVLSTSLLAVTFYQADLYGSMVLNLYLIPTVIYGWFVWGRDSNPRPVERVKLRTLPAYVAVTAAVWYGALLIIEGFGGTMAVLDGWLLVGTILAQFLMDRKKLENWAVWITVNVVSIYVYLNAGLYLLAIQFALFILNTVIAWYQWNKTMKTQAEAGARPAPVLEDLQEAVA